MNLGNPDGEPVLFFHGYSQTSRSLMGLAALFDLSRSYCVFPDLPGHGENGARLSLEAVTEFLGELREKYAFRRALGYSMGAQVALLSSARDLFLVSPPAQAAGFSPDVRRELLEAFQPRWVREERAMSGLSEVLAAPRPGRGAGTRTTVLYGSRDLEACKVGARDFEEARSIAHATHALILQSPELEAEVRRWSTAG